MDNALWVAMTLFAAKIATFVRNMTRPIFSTRRHRRRTDDELRAFVLAHPIAGASGGFHQSPFEELKYTQCINPADLGDGATNGSVIDMQGWDGIVFIAIAGALGAGGTLDLKAQGDDAVGFGSPTDITGAAITQVPDTGDNKSYMLDVWRPTERFIRGVVTIGGAGVAVVVGLVAVQYRFSGKTPITQDATVGSIKKVAVN